jgi:hypothetical protein
MIVQLCLALLTPKVLFRLWYGISEYLNRFSAYALVEE